MNSTIKFTATILFTAMATATFANPLPDLIVQEGKAVVPVTKTQIITTGKGLTPVRTTDTTVLDITHQGKNIVSKDIEQVEATDSFATGKMAIPSVQEKAVIVPTSKIVVNTTVTQAGVVVEELKQVDATGVEFKAGHEPVRKNLQLDSITTPEGKATHAVISNDGKATKGLTIIAPNQAQ